MFKINYSLKYIFLMQNKDCDFLLIENRLNKNKDLFVETEGLNPLPKKSLKTIYKFSFLLKTN